MCFLFIVSYSTLAQTDSTKAPKDSLSYYFDDDNLSTTYNIIKISPTQILSGELTLQYERAIGKTLSFEAGIGVWSGNGFIEPFINYPDPRMNARLTYNFAIKNYIALDEVNTRLQGVYTGFFYRYREAIYDLNSTPSGHTRYKTDDVHLISGFQWFSIWRLTIDGMLGFGVTFVDESRVNVNTGLPSGSFDFQFSYQVNLKAGLRF